ncbi:UNVERIFIED_CONTAM: hypothetical protein Sindi_2513600 [Sesamum indicum]
MSLEALAMSGANFLEVGFDMDEWEQMESEIPPHLLADDEEEDDEKKVEQKNADYEFPIPFLLYDQRGDDDESIDGGPWIGENSWNFMNKKNVFLYVMITFWIFMNKEKCRKIATAFISIACNFL